MTRTIDLCVEQRKLGTGPRHSNEKRKQSRRSFGLDKDPNNKRPKTISKSREVKDLKTKRKRQAKRLDELNENQCQILKKSLKTQQ